MKVTSEKNLNFGDLSPLALGDIVQLRTAEAESGATEIRITQGNITTILKAGQHHMTPPAMVVVEVVREQSSNAQLFNEQSGSAIRDRIKVLCQWFSQKKGAFEERWFNIGALKRLNTEGVIPSTEMPKINDVVTLKTAYYANQQRVTILENALGSDTESAKYQTTRTFDTLHFAPPKMVVTHIEPPKEQPNLFDKNSGERIRIAKTAVVSCLWYDHVSGKFSEHKFAQEVLMLANDLSDLPLETLLNP